MNDVPLTDSAAKPSALDIQHDTDPADDRGPARRIPHLGHALLFFSLAAFFTLTSLAILLSILVAVTHTSTELAARQHPVLGLLGEALGYILTLIAAAWIFPHLWRRSFLHGIQWNVLAAHRRWFWIVPAGVLLCAAAQLAMHFLPAPHHAEIEDMLVTPAGAWTTALFGTLLAPLMEEIAFRGFLLPALATAYDWLALERSPAGLERWQNSSAHSTSAVVFATIFSSIPFALLHASQIGYAWGVVGVLFGVSLVLSTVRVRTHSVACSTLLHATYNASIFFAIFLSTGGFRHLNSLH